MSLRTTWSRLRGMFQSDARLREEIDQHLELLAADYEARGLSADEARAKARREFGAVTQLAEQHREQRRLPLLDTFWRDLVYAARQMRANPAFTATAILTLALGIGANTAIFRVLDFVVLRTLPVRDPQSLVLVEGKLSGGPDMSYPVFREMAARQQVLEGMIASAGFPIDQAGPTGAATWTGIRGRVVSGNYFDLLGVDAHLGRALAPDDDTPNAAPVAVISDALWHRAFGASPDVLGRKLQVNRAVVTVVGVAPTGFFGERLGDPPDLYLPISLVGQVWFDWRTAPGTSVISVMGRLRPGISFTQARTALDALFRQLDGLGYRVDGKNDYRLSLKPGGRGLLSLQGKFARPLTILMGIVGLVLLMACCNVANLLLARSTARRHEIGMRLALGAGRGRILRQLLTENFALALAGSAAGIVIAIWGSRELVTLASVGDQWRLSLDFGWRILGFTLVVSIAAVFVFGLAPAWWATRLDLNRALQSGRRSATDSGSGLSAIRAVLAAQVAISLMLVTGASLLVRSCWNLMHQDFGYRVEDVLAQPTRLDFGTLRPAGDPALVQPLLDRLRALPGVRSAALSGIGPLTSFVGSARLSIPERPSQDSDGGRLAAVTPTYFETMGIPILSGRSFSDDDRATSAPVAIVTATAARRVFGTTDCIGRFASLGVQFDPRKVVQIVGVAHDLRFSDPRDPFSMIVFVPLAQNRSPLSLVLLRTTGDPMGLAPATAAVMRELAPRIKIDPALPLTDLLERHIGQDKMLAILSGAFGFLALLLASIGLYGVVAYGVERRTQEIGIRLALGASRTKVTGMLVREVMTVLAGGVFLGSVGALILGRYARTILFGLTEHDPTTLLAAVAVLSAVSLLAAWAPAHRASRLDPMDALRQE